MKDIIDYLDKICKSIEAKSNYKNVTSGSQNGIYFVKVNRTYYNLDSHLDDLQNGISFDDSIDNIIEWFIQSGLVENEND